MTFLKFANKWMELKHILSDPVTEEHTLYVLTDKWILGKKLGIPPIQFTNHMKLKKKEDQSVDVSILFRRGNKIIMGCRGSEGLGRKREGGRGKGDRI